MLWNSKTDFSSSATCAQVLHCKLTVFVKISIWNTLGWSDAVSVIYPITDHLCDFNFWKINQTGRYFPCWEPGSHLSCALFLSFPTSNKHWDKKFIWKQKEEAVPAPWHPTSDTGIPIPQVLWPATPQFTQNSHLRKAKPHEVCT